MAWNDERVELLKRLWAEGLSASQIASRLGGVTRNAVIGKVHRLGLSGRATSSRSSSPRPRRVQAPRQHRAPSLMFGTRGNVALKPVYEEEIEPAPAPIEELYIPPAERATILTSRSRCAAGPSAIPARRSSIFAAARKAARLPIASITHGLPTRQRRRGGAIGGSHRASHLPAQPPQRQSRMVKWGEGWRPFGASFFAYACDSAQTVSCSLSEKA